MICLFYLFLSIYHYRGYYIHCQQKYSNLLKFYNSTKNLLLSDNSNNLCYWLKCIYNSNICNHRRRSILCITHYSLLEWNFKWIKKYIVKEWVLKETQILTKRRITFDRNSTIIVKLLITKYSLSTTIKEICK